MTRSNRHPNRVARYVFRLGVAVCVVIDAALAEAVLDAAEDFKDVEKR